MNRYHRINRKKLMKALDQKDTFIMTYRQVAQNRTVYCSIDVKSERNVGTEFSVTLTLQKGGRNETEQIGEFDPSAMYVLIMDWNMPGMSGREASVEVLKQYKKETTQDLRAAASCSRRTWN